MDLRLRLRSVFFVMLLVALPGTAAGQVLPPGPQVLSFHSDVDDTEQPYALYLPPDFDASRRYPLVVSLHGAGSNHRLNLRRVFGKSNAPGETDVEASRYFPEWEDVDYIVVAPYARGTMGYQGVAEKDVLDVLEDVKRRFPIDEDRTYLTGLSMGGGGTLWLGLTRPDLWAAIAPVCPAPPPAAETFAPNALHVPVHFFQGGADPVVRAEGVRAWAERLEGFGTQVEYVEYPGVGHDSWVNAYEDGRIFEWFDRFRRDPHPDHVRFVTDRYRYDSAYWVRLDALTPGATASIDARFTADDRLDVTTAGLDGFTLDLAGHPRYTGSGPVAVRIDGRDVEAPAGAVLSFSRRWDGWMAGRYEAEAHAKRRGAEGPMAEALAQRHVYVYGTGGEPSREAVGARRAVAAKAADWAVDRGWFLGRIMVFPRVAADREVRPSDLQSANLVLFGTKETNSLIAQFADRLPLHLDAGAEDYGLVYVYPVGDHYVLVNAGLPWWTTGVAGEGSPFSGGVAAFALPAGQDYLLFEGSVENVVAAGRFDRDWRVPLVDAEKMRATGVVDVLAAALPADVGALLGAMTLDEKLSMIRGTRDPSGEAGAGFIPGVPRLGIPPLRLADGPAGIRTAQPATALPAPVALAASFDPGLARRFGRVIGREGRARNQDVLLSPMVNIVRVPQAGRNFETFGEDPLLAARMVAEEIRGIEGEGLLATVKHYAANNFEHERMTVDAVVDERALHEVYLPGFEAAVEAGVGSVMCAYNRVNGTYACENDGLLRDVLRDRYGFEGWVMTDWFARHSLDALEAGLDQEMPGLSFGRMQPVYFGDSLRVAVEAGRIPQAAVDVAVRRILVQMSRMGLLAGSMPPRPAMDAGAGSAVACEVALAGAVLLRNEERTLPLAPADLANVVVIGPTARTPLYGGGGSSQVTPLRLESVLSALQRRAGRDVQLRYAAGIDLDGVPVPADVLTPAGSPTRGGLLRTAPDSTTQLDAGVDYTGDGVLSPVAPAGATWTWAGTLTAPSTGDYELKLQSTGGRATLALDGDEVLATGGFFGNASLIPTTDGLENATHVVHLRAGEPREIRITAGGGGFGSMQGAAGRPLQVRLAWVTPERRQTFLDEAAAVARTAEAAVVFAYDEGTEGRDRPSLALPGVQDALVEAVATANPRTAVVLNTGDPVLMPWLERTGAVLQMWYPGQEGADATAALLVGEAGPAGRLPVTFPQDDTQTPVAAPARYPGVDGRAVYDEGIFVGYRWFDAQDVTPLFPFGYGLSYTTFDYADLAVTPAGDGFDVTFRVRNTGDRTGVEVPQVYLGPPADAPVPMEPRKLAGFARIELAPGEGTTVTVHVGKRTLSYWSSERDEWVVAAGTRPVYVGASSRDARLQDTVQVRGD